MRLSAMWLGSLLLVHGPGVARDVCGGTVLVSVDSAGQRLPGASYDPSVSADGQFVAFVNGRGEEVSVTSSSHDQQEAMPTTSRILLRDLQQGETIPVSLTPRGDEANAWSAAPRVSADGSRLVFVSAASNLVAGDLNQAPDVFVYDRVSRIIDRASVASDESEGHGWSDSPAISGEGGAVAFASDAPDLVEDDTNEAEDVFLRGLDTGVTVRISVSSSGEQAEGGPSAAPSLSQDGRLVAFHSWSENLVREDLNAEADVFLRDVLEGTTWIVSVGGDGTQGNAGSYGPRLSNDGRGVLFSSDASNLVFPDGNGIWALAHPTSDVFLRDRVTDETRRVSVGPGGTEPIVFPRSEGSAVSAESRYVGFVSDAPNLVVSDTNLTSDAFVHDTGSGRTVRVSVGNEGQEANGPSSAPALDGAGSLAVFSSRASNLTETDTNSKSDVFLRDIWCGST